MKISTRRILLTTFAGAGLFALSLAYRSAPPETSSLMKNGLPMVLPQNAVMSHGVPANEQPIPTPLTLPDATVAFDADRSPSIPDLETFESTIDLTEEPRFSKAADRVVEPVQETILYQKAKGWQANPFLGSSKQDSTAELVSAELELEAERNVDVVSSDLSEAVPAEVQPEVNVSSASAGQTLEPTNVVSGLSESSAHKAVHHIEYGKSLARRNASEAASQEFLTALRILAEANDSLSGSNHYTASLRNGLLAIKEAGDFKTDDPQRQIVVNVSNIVEGHETQVFDRERAQTMSATDAIHHYLIYAGEQLATCGGRNAVAAEALYCLGKMRSITAQEDANPESLDLMQAIVYHHASLTADPSNFRSANELGVLLARNGQLDEAETFLKASLQIRPMPQSWANLAKVHQRKGTAQDLQLANLAMSEYQSALQTENVAAASGAIQWVDSATFAARSAAEYPEGMPTSLAPTQAAVVPASNIETGQEKKSFVQRIGELIPKSIRR